jgi:hypothetical protein
MKVKEILEQTDKMYSLLMEAYEIAGGLRDSFSGISGSDSTEGALKNHCNSIRGKIYEIREMKGSFIQIINTLK